jgi:hypothetical protein
VRAQFDKLVLDAELKERASVSECASQQKSVFQTDVRLRGDACQDMGELESVALRIPVEAAAIDSFITEIKDMDMERIGAKASLHMAG